LTRERQGVSVCRGVNGNTRGDDVNSSLSYSLTVYRHHAVLFVSVFVPVLLVTLALLVYAGCAAVLGSIEITGSRVFEWAFFIPVGGVVLALIAAILFLVEGRRGPSDIDGDGEETAKMV